MEAFKQKQASQQQSESDAAAADSATLSRSTSAEVAAPSGWRRQFRCCAVPQRDGVVSLLQVLMLAYVLVLQCLTHVDVPLRCRLLFARSWRQATRDKATNIARAGTNISSALIFGSIYFRMRRSQSTIQDRLGLLQVRMGSGSRGRLTLHAEDWHRVMR